MKRKRTSVALRVSMDLPDGVTAVDAQNYVRSAVQSWKGGLDPEDPIFELDHNKVRVSLLKKTTIYE